MKISSRWRWNPNTPVYRKCMNGPTTSTGPHVPRTTADNATVFRPSDSAIPHISPQRRTDGDPFISQDVQLPTLQWNAEPPATSRKSRRARPIAAEQGIALTQPIPPRDRVSAEQREERTRAVITWKRLLYTDARWPVRSGRRIPCRCRQGRKWGPLLSTSRIC